MCRMLVSRSNTVDMSLHSSVTSLFWTLRFAAALIDQPLWVMNTVPPTAPDTLPIIFDRGLIGIYHDWCEAFNTYPRTYDLLHSSNLFGKLSQRYVLDNKLVYQFLRHSLCPSCWGFASSSQVLDRRGGRRNGSDIEARWLGVDPRQPNDDREVGFSVQVPALGNDGSWRAASRRQEGLLASGWQAVTWVPHILLACRLTSCAFFYMPWISHF